MSLLSVRTLRKHFKEAIGDRIEKICADLDVEIAYAYQELDALPEGIELPEGRTKPWEPDRQFLRAKMF